MLERLAFVHLNFGQHGHSTMAYRWGEALKLAGYRVDHIGLPYNGKITKAFREDLPIHCLPSRPNRVKDTAKELDHYDALLLPRVCTASGDYQDKRPGYVDILEQTKTPMFLWVGSIGDAENEQSPWEDQMFRMTSGFIVPRVEVEKALEDVESVNGPIAVIPSPAYAGAPPKASDLKKHGVVCPTVVQPGKRIDRIFQALHMHPNVTFGMWGSRSQSLAMYRLEQKYGEDLRRYQVQEGYTFQEIPRMYAKYAFSIDADDQVFARQDWLQNVQVESIRYNTVPILDRRFCPEPGLAVPILKPTVAGVADALKRAQRMTKDERRAMLVKGKAYIKRERGVKKLTRRMDAFLQETI